MQIQSALINRKTRNLVTLLPFSSLLCGHRFQYLAEINNKLNKVHAQRNSYKGDQNRKRKVKKLNQNHS